MKNNLQDFDRQWNTVSRDSEAPVFVLSAGWRSGSTLLQRLLCSSQEVLLWGEPYARCGMVQHLAASSEALRSNYPHKDHFLDARSTDLQTQWIANFFPPPSQLKDTYRSALDAFLAKGAALQGFPRFGLKEVRLDADHGRFLQWVYPDARFFCLVRNPWDAWQSAKGLELYLSWPDQPVNSAESFARHWLRLVESFADWRHPAVFFFRYEDLIGHPNAVRGVQAHSQVESLDPTVLNQVVGQRADKVPLSPSDVETIDAIAGEAARSLGYGPQGGLLAA